MIPKTIHFCWLSNDPHPVLVRRCLNSWRKKLPDYTIKLWNKERFDAKSVPFVYQAIEKCKWAFAADYIRLYALYTEGGVYLDSDVLVNQSFDPLLVDDFFTATEYYPATVDTSQLLADGSPLRPKEAIHGFGLQAAVIGAAAGHPYIKACLDYYTDLNFVAADGSLYNKIILPDIMAIVAQDFGLKYLNQEQRLDQGMVIYPNTVFCDSSLPVSADTYAVHYANNSWVDKSWSTKVRQSLARQLWVKTLKRWIQKS